MNFKEKIKELHKKFREGDFEVDDRVKVVGQGTGIVEDISPQGDFYLVNINGKKIYVNGSNLKLIKRPSESVVQLFNKGAKVRTTEGLVGVITKTFREKNKVLHWVNNQGPFTEKELMRGKENV